MLMINRQASFEERGVILSGLNHEVRALTIGISALNGGHASVSFIHNVLTGFGYDRFHELSTSHILSLVNKTHPDLIETQVKSVNDEIQLSDTGVTAASFVGPLLQEASLAHNIPLHILVGGYKKTPHNPDLIPGPSARLAVYDIMLCGPKKGRPIGEVRNGVEPLGVTQKSIRKHFEALEDRGLARNLGNAKGTRVLTPAFSEIAEDYSELIHRLLDNPADRDPDQSSLSSIFDKRADVIPYLAKRALTANLSNWDLRINTINQQLRSYTTTLPEGTTFTSADVAEELGISVESCQGYLRRIEINLGPSSSVMFTGKTRGRGAKLYVAKSTTRSRE